MNFQKFKEIRIFTVFLVFLIWIPQKVDAQSKKFQGPLDIIVIIHQIDGKSKENLGSTMLNKTHQLPDFFQISDRSVRVGIIYGYRRSAAVILPITGNEGSLLKTSLGQTWLGPSMDTENILEMVKKHMFTKISPGSPKVIILITEAKNQYFVHMMNDSRQFRNDNIPIFAALVGNFSDMEEKKNLTEIVGDPSRIYEFDNFAKLAADVVKHFEISNPSSGQPVKTTTTTTTTTKPRGETTNPVPRSRGGELRESTTGGQEKIEALGQWIFLIAFVIMNRSYKK